MKRAHQRSHIGIWLVLTPAMAAIIWLAVNLRPSVPINPSLPSALVDEVSDVP